jgi:PAS domain S-box-containing protein
MNLRAGQGQMEIRPFVEGMMNKKAGIGKEPSVFMEDAEYLRDFFENGPVGFHIFGPDRGIIDINRAELDMLGYTRSEIVGRKTWADLIIPDQQPLFEQHWRNLVKTGRVRNLNYTLLHKDGHQVHVILNATARKDRKGKILNTRGSVLDITQRKQAEEALRLTADKLEQQKAALENKNIALGEVLARIEVEKKQVERHMMSNIENLIMPLLGKLKRKGSRIDLHCIELLETNLKALMSAFGAAVSQERLRLSPREIEICNMIKNGLRTKEIADVLKTSCRTIDNHRNRIRKKLGISQREINLISYLQNIPQA